MPAIPCPVCGRSEWDVARPAAALRREIRDRDAFFRRRVRPDAPSRDDVAEFGADGPADLLRCRSCGFVTRGPVPAADAIRSWREDHYVPEALDAILSRHEEFFRARDDVRAMFPPGARPRVLEVGCYAGGFLAASRSWGWRAMGVDVGREVCAFVSARGLPVHEGLLPFLDLAPVVFDACFVWNCFDQLPDPVPYLEKVREVLADGGRVVLRVPDARYYLRLAALRDDLPRSDPRGADLDRALFLSGLGGFPYLHGFDGETLPRLVRERGFDVTDARPAAPLPPPRGTLTDQADREALAWTAPPGVAGAPWLEVVATRR